MSEPEVPEYSYDVLLKIVKDLEERYINLPDGCPAGMNHVLEQDGEHSASCVNCGTNFREEGYCNCDGEY